MTVFATLLHLAIVASMPPLLLGIIARTKAAFAGRAGPPLLQPYHDLVKLSRKGTVLSTTTTWVFRAGPVVGLASAVLASLLVPLGDPASPVSFSGDLVFLAYLFALSRFFTVSAALDTGSPFEGMGAARDAAFACLAEPAFFLGMLVLVRRSGSTSLAAMLGSTGQEQVSSGASLVLVVVSLFLVLLAESSRVPFDDPTTHLELTMIHEVMVLDHGGPALAMILYGASVKLFVLGAIVVRIAVPLGLGTPWLDWGAFGLGMVALAAAIGIVESVMARLRLTQIPRLLVSACILSAFGIVLLAR